MHMDNIMKLSLSGVKVDVSFEVEALAARLLSSILPLPQTNTSGTAMYIMYSSIQ